MVTKYHQLCDSVLNTSLQTVSDILLCMFRAQFVLQRLNCFLMPVSLCSCAGLEVEGIFRRSASAVTLRKVQGLFNEGEQCNFLYS